MPEIRPEKINVSDVIKRQLRYDQAHCFGIVRNKNGIKINNGLWLLFLFILLALRIFDIAGNVWFWVFS